MPVIMKRLSRLSSAFGTFLLLSSCILLVSCGKSPENPLESVKREFTFQREAVAKSAEQLLFYKDKHPFVVPLVINVGLIGFDGNGGFNYSFYAQELESLLGRSLPVYQPSSMEAKETLHIQYQVSYNVIQLNAFHLTSVEDAIKANLKDTGLMVTPDGAAASVPVYEVDAVAVDEALERAYATNFGYIAGGSHRKMEESTAPYAILVLNPSKHKMLPHGVSAENDVPFVYRYKYAGVGSTQTWLSKGRYAVIDVSAGPSQYGTTRVGEGTVSAGSIPRVERIIEAERHLAEKHSKEKKERKVPRLGEDGQVIEDDFDDIWPEYSDPGAYREPSNKQTEFLAQLSTLIVSAIQNVFIPDVRFDCLDVAEKVLLPIIVLRNHRKFDPLEPGHEMSIDVQKVIDEVQRMVLPSQEVTVISGTHSLFEHKHIALAVARALRSDSTHESGGAAGRYTVKMRAYVDSSVLKHEMINAADLLAGGLIGGDNPALHNTFFNRATKESAEDPREKQSQGVRVLPVYVFSLLGLDRDILFDQTSLVSVTHDMVLVLQTSSEAVQVPYFVEDTSMSVNPRKATRHIIAGVAAAFGGIVAPYERYSPMLTRRTDDLKWALGHHPFGIFSNTSGMPEMLVDMVLRNSVLSRLNSALTIIVSALNRIEHFANEYVYDPSGEQISVATTRRSILDRLHRRDSGVQSPLTYATVDRLHSDLKRLEKQFVSCSQFLYNFRLDDAHNSASSVLVHARAFRAYAMSEIDKAINDMRCCRVQQETRATDTEQTSVWVYAAVLLVGGGVYYGIVSRFTSGPQSHTRHKRKTPSRYTGYGYARTQ